MNLIDITDREFNSIRSFIYEHVGIKLSDTKKALVTSRLNKRLWHHSLDSYQDYYDLIIASPPDGERQMAIDLLTTNETYFFREPKHFAFLEEHILPSWRGGRSLKLWSAASSTGEEAYSLAMLLDDVLSPRTWDIFGSDISDRVLKSARRGLYSLDRTDGIPKAFLKKYCLKGYGQHEGTLLIDSKLRNKVSFSSVNLKKPLPELGLFDIIFLRNVLIYFDQETKQQIIRQLVEKLQPGGYLFIGHSESLKDIRCSLNMIAPTIYHKSSI